MPTVTDSTGRDWNLNITTKDVTLVERLVKDADGKPVDLLKLADTGTLPKILRDSRRMIDIVFVCTLDQIKPLFSEADFDAAHQLEYVIEPELKNDPLRKMAMWFAERIDAQAIGAITDAFVEALLLFIRNPRQREAVTRQMDSVNRVTSAAADRTIQATAALEKQALAKIEANIQKELEKQLETLEIKAAPETASEPNPEPAPGPKPASPTENLGPNS